ncbi:MAG TPA: hypothetical protein VFE62_15180 [Gemmataceae bacterium]|nr:hypothetical protein [Gemmataceae bacterium]
MIQSIWRRSWFGLIALASLSTIGAAQAWDLPRVNTELKFKFEVTVGPEQLRPSAPWYTYFPADPRMMPSPQLTPYPSWPGQFPPAAQPFDRGGVQKQSYNAPVPTNPMLTQYRAIPYGYHLQTVSYTPAQVPSYWYQGR